VTDTLDNLIKTNAEGPAKASGDSGSVEQHKPSEQIAADNRSKASSTCPGT